MSSTRTTETSEFRGNDKLLLGIVLAVVTFWLFAGSAGTVVVFGGYLAVFWRRQRRRPTQY